MSRGRLGRAGRLIRDGRLRRRHGGSGDGVHPPLLDRAFEELCMMEGSTPQGSPYCQTLYRFVKARWTMAIGMAGTR